MTNTGMIAFVHSLLDDLTTNIFDDTLDVYPALSAGQREYTARILDQFIARNVLAGDENVPYTLKPLQKTYTNNAISATTTLVTYPTDYLYNINVMYVHENLGADLIPAYKRGTNEKTKFIQDNSLMQSLASGTYYYELAPTGWLFEIPAGTGGGKMAADYISNPTDISASIQPLLPAITHEAICIYAYFKMMLKIKQLDIANLAYQDFLSRIKYL